MVCKETEREDDEKWMEISPEDLEAMLSARAGGSGAEMQNMPADMDMDLGRLAESFEKFVDHGAGLEGAEFPGEEDADMSTDESDSDEDTDLRDNRKEDRKYSDKAPNSQDVEFDPAKFMELMQSMLGECAVNSLD